MRTSEVYLKIKTVAAVLVLLSQAAVAAIATVTAGSARESPISPRISGQPPAGSAFQGGTFGEVGGLS